MPNTVRNNIRLTDELIEEFIDAKSGLKEETLAIYKRSIKDFRDWLPEPKELTKLAAMSYGRYLSTVYSKRASIRQRLSAITQLYKHFNISLDGKEVTSSLESSANPASLTEKEYEALLLWAQSEGDIPLYIALEAIYTLDLSGDAVIEMITVESATRGSIFVEEARTLTEKRLIPSLAATILAYAEEENIRSGWVFASNRGRGRMDRGTLSKKLRRAAAALDISPGISLSDVRRLGRQTAEEIAASAVYKTMEQRHIQINTKEINKMTRRKHAPVPALSKPTIESAMIDEHDIREFLYECVSAPSEAMETWYDANDICHKGWLHDYITESFRAQTPLIFPEAIEKVKTTEEYADIRRYIDLPIATPGVEVFFQDGAYHVASPLELEWITSADGEEPDCSRIACRLVNNLLQEAGMFLFSAEAFLGWSVSLIPSFIVEFYNDDSLLLDENGIVVAIHPATGEEATEKDLVWFRGKSFCCHMQHKEKLEARFFCKDKRNA